MSWASRFSRVSSFLALITHQLAVRRYQGGWAWKNFQAFRLCAEHVRQLGGVSPLPNQMEVKG
jgi:hypothetical protein